MTTDTTTETAAVPVPRSRPRLHLRSEGTVYQRSSDRRWVGRLSHRGQRKSYYGANKTEAQEKLRMARAIVAVSGTLPDLAATVDHAVDQFRGSGIKPHNFTVRPGLFPGYLDMIATALGDLPIAYLTEDDVRERLYEPALNQLDDRCFTELRETTVRLFDYAKAWGFIAQNPAMYQTALPERHSDWVAAVPGNGEGWSDPTRHS